MIENLESHFCLYHSSLFFSCFVPWQQLPKTTYPVIHRLEGTCKSSFTVRENWAPSSPLYLYICVLAFQSSDLTNYKNYI